MGFFFRTKSTAKTSQLVSKLEGEQLKSDIIINAIDDGVVIIDDEQMIHLMNPAGASMIGWEKSETEGLDWHSVFSFVDKKGVPQQDTSPLTEVFAKGSTIRRNDLQLVTKSNKTINLSMTVSPLIRDNEQVKAVVGIFRDTSEEKREEAQRAEFISTASHEMRTPVAAIEGYLALALNEKVSSIDSRARGFLEKAHSSTQHLGKLFQDLLSSAKAEDGRLTSHPSVIEFGSYLEQISNDLRFTAEKKGLLLEFNIGASKVIDASRRDIGKPVNPLYYAYADPDRMREVITNLFDNAVKYSEKGKITVGLTGNDKVVQFFIRDMGHGIPSEDVPHLFQKFYRVDNSTTRTIGGTGLGLFICRKIVELYQGRIWVESELEKGSTFYVNLPRLTTQKAEQMKATEDANPDANILTA